MNKIWPWILVISLSYGIVTGKSQELTTCIFDSGKTVIDTCITIFGMISLWCGFIKIAEKTGVLAKFQRFVYPLMKFLFPELKSDNPALPSIAMNLTANMIGIGNVATPTGIAAMEELQKQNKDKTRLSKSMMMLLVLNMSSIQIMPTTIIALRSSYGSEDPAAIVIPVMISSIIAVLFGVIVVKVFWRN